GIHHATTLPVGGRSWSVLARPSSSYVAKRRTIAPWAVLAGGLGFALLLGGYVAHLSESRVRYRQMFTGNCGIKLLVDPANARIVDANPAAAAYYGYSVEELRGAHLSLVDLQRPEQIAEQLRGAAAGESTDIPGNHRLASGQIRDVEVHCSVVILEQRTLLYCMVQDVTERRRTEEERQRSLSMMAAALDSSADGILVVDNAGRVLVCNRRFFELWNLPPDWINLPTRAQRLSALHRQLVDPERAIQRTEQIRSDPEGSGYEIVELVDGRIFEVYAHPCRNGRSVVGRVWSYRDLTERQRAEKALLRATMRFNMLTEGSLQGVLVHRDLKPLFANAALARMLGFTAVEDVLAMPSLEDFVAPHERQRIREYVARRARGEDVPALYEFEGQRRDGTAIWFANAVSRVDWDGLPATQNTLIDITEQRRAQLELESQRDWLNTLINALPDFIAFKDGEGRWIVANDFARNLLQLRNYDYRGKTDQELGEVATFHAEALRYCVASDTAAWAAACLVRAEEAFPTLDGGVTVFDVLKVPLFNDDGSRKGLVVVGRDVTDRKQAERQAENARR
ncbi:MAG: PAS domain-containing protein, partial [Rhodospirillales bacterium]|nr:PAS domain-containing protein [Rhodospirillales bacterium]